MFYSMYLTIEMNKFEQRFDGTMAKAIKEVVQQESDVYFQEKLYDIFEKFNRVVHIFDDIFKSEADIYEDYIESGQEQYLNIVLQELNVLYVLYCKGNFYKIYSKYYWQATQNFILELWKESPDKITVSEKEASFMKIFEDLYSNTLKKMPELCVRKLSEFKNLYRASTYEVYDNYNYILPNPIYCKYNRLNDDGVAYLYF